MVGAVRFSRQARQSEEPSQRDPPMDDGTRIALVTKVTGNTWRDEPGYVVLRDWQDAGLSKPSAVRCSQLLRLPSNLFLDDGPTGRLSAYDAGRVTWAINELYPGLLA